MRPGEIVSERRCYDEHTICLIRWTNHLCFSKRRYGRGICRLQTLRINWLSLRRLVSWINHLPLACWSTIWKSIFKQQLGCRFDIMDSISSFFNFDICNYICLDTSYHFLALSLLLKYFLFFKNSCTNIFHRRSLCTFYFNKIEISIPTFDVDLVSSKFYTHARENDL